VNSSFFFPGSFNPFAAPWEHFMCRALVLEIIFSTHSLYLLKFKNRKYVTVPHVAQGLIKIGTHFLSVE
jgi:hypothetical protein